MIRPQLEDRQWKSSRRSWPSSADRDGPGRTIERFGQLPHGAECSWLPAGHPVQRQPSRETCVRQGAVHGASGDRMHVQSAQAGSALRHALREDTPQLRCGSCHWIRPARSSGANLLRARALGSRSGAVSTSSIRFRSPPVAPDLEISTIRRFQPSPRSGLCGSASWAHCLTT